MHRQALRPRRPAFAPLIPCLIATLAHAASDPPPALRAGAARIDITPSRPCLLSGYASRTEPHTAVHDPLSARALALEHDGRRLLLLSADVIGFYAGTAAPLREAICTAAKLAPEELLLAAIHTHSAPTLGVDPAKLPPNNIEYTSWLRDRLATVARQALERLLPAEIGFGTGFSPVGINRREPYQTPRGQRAIRLGRNPAGPTDPEVQVLRVRARDGDAIVALLFAYATHGTSLGAKNLVVSGDVHGLAEQFVERYLGAETVAPAFAGASGNIDPWFRVLPELKTANGWIPEPVLLGTMLGEEAIHASDKITDPAPGGPIRSLLKTVELPPKPGRALTDYTTSTLTLTAARIGDVAIVGLGGEVFHEIGKAIKRSSPFPHTIVVTHCNGAAGYLITDDAHPQGGYEVNVTPFAPGAADRVLKEISAMLAQLQ